MKIILNSCPYTLAVPSGQVSPAVIYQSSVQRSIPIRIWFLFGIISLFLAVLVNLSSFTCKYAKACHYRRPVVNLIRTHKCCGPEFVALVAERKVIFKSYT